MTSNRTDSEANSLGNVSKGSETPEWLEKLFPEGTTCNGVGAMEARNIIKRELGVLVEELTEQVLGLYPTDVFVEMDYYELEKLNELMPGATDRIHCDGIRFGMVMIRKYLQESNLTL